MGMKMRIAGALLAVAAAAVIWFLWSGSGTPDVQPGGGSVATPHNAPAPATADIGEEQPAPTADPAGHPTQRSEVAVEPQAGPKATVRGRCVDAAGAPLAGCGAALNGWNAGTERMDAWLRDHGEPPAWQNPPTITTGADGRFELTFWPPPPFTFALSIGAEGLTTMTAHLHRLEPGSNTDFGDVVMRPGVQVRGRLVDEQGVAIANHSLNLNSQIRERNARVQAVSSVGFRTGADGTFASDTWLAPGTYAVQVRWLELLSDPTIELVASRPHEDLLIVGRRPPADSIITGRVVDETGAPAPKILVDDVSLRGNEVTETRRDGTFDLRRHAQQTAAAAKLLLHSELHDVDSEHAREVAWGTRDVEFKVVRAGSLTVRITDAKSIPVEHYSLRLLSRSAYRRGHDDRHARASGRHADGTVTIPGMCRGDWLLFVEFPTDSGLPPLYEAFSHEGGSRRVDLSAALLARRTVRIVDHAGVPVAGSEVQLCEPFGQPGRNDSFMRWDKWAANRHRTAAMILSAQHTDADGRVELIGIGNRELGLRAMGPGHVPTAPCAIRLDVAAEFELRVSRGARLVGKVVPPEALAELKRLAGSQKDPPRLQLRSATQALPHDWEPDNLKIAADGSFDASSLPPGTWEVAVCSWIASATYATSHNFPAGEVVLVDGQTLQRDLDLTAILPGRIEGLATHNGAPAANAVVSLDGSGRWQNITTDADGRFAVDWPTGQCKVLLQFNDQRAGHCWLNCANPAVVVRGATTRQTFAFEGGRLVIHVRKEDATPVRDLRLSLLPAAGYGRMLEPTDAAGRAEFVGDPTEFTVRVLPKKLSDPAAQQKAREEGAARGEQDPLAKHWIVLTTVTVAPGQTTPVEIKLPASAGY